MATRAFWVSAGLNVILLSSLAVLHWRAADREVWHPEAPLPRMTGHAEVSNASIPASKSASVVAGGRLEAATLEQLEQIGISRSVLVSAMLEDFHRRWDKRGDELERRYAPKQVPEREYIELARQREVERERTIKAFLGEEGYLAWDKERALHLVNSAGLPISRAEADQAYRLQKDFDEKHAELQMAMEDGVADKADASALQRQAQETLERELEKLFGKERLAQMRGQTDASAEVYRRFGDLNPTPIQAAAVLRAEEDYRSREAELAQRAKQKGADPAQLQAELKALANAREEDLRRIFGTSAYDSARRENDPSYKTLKQYAAAWNLHAHEADSVYRAVSAFHEEAERRRLIAQMQEAAGEPVNWADVNGRIEKTRTETEAALAALIGTDRLRRLKQNDLLTTH